ARLDACSWCTSAHRRHSNSFPTRRSSDLGDFEADILGSAFGAFAVADHANFFRHAPAAVTGWARSGLLDITKDCTHNVSHLSRRSEEHTSELQSQSNLVCRLLLEKKK